MDTVSKSYDPQGIEKKWYAYWKTNGYFKPSGKGDPFVIVIPPPNITGKLHIGHGLNMTLQDIATRFNRMLGKDTLWLPGEDHAGIATQGVVEKKLREKGSSKELVGREKFVEITWEWAKEYREYIQQQIERIGSSVDWDRDRFTLDEGLNRAVRKAFVQLYHKGLIYKGKYLVNWCPRCQTVLSDEEVEHVDEKSSLWYIRYFLKDSTQFLTVATTRPETMLGDTAVAVNPSDERYKDWIGMTLILPIMNREIPVIADHYVDPKFGTGAVKVTPAHDPNDYQIGIRHGLPMVEVIGADSKMTAEAGIFQGFHYSEARKKVVEHLEANGYLQKTEDYTHAVGHCYRCSQTIDPRLSDQWFVRMKPLAKPAIDVVEQGRVQFHPDRWKKVYLNWMYDVHDWCISRQLWWGHRIPVWYCQDCGHVNVAEHAPDFCEKCHSTHLVQDADVLDTWFSSALWPFSTLGWPEETQDLKRYYPTSLLSTGFDILFFWVARMVFMGLEFMDDIPFQDVYIHQLIRDKKGRKMSKSLGNGIDPIEVIEEYGADAMRFTLAISASQGRDICLDPKQFEAYKHFANKIWNASRFAFMNLENFQSHGIDIQALTLADKWILTTLNRTIEKVTDVLQHFEFNVAAKILYNFFWNEFCDWYLESAKPVLYDAQAKHSATIQNTKEVLSYLLDTSLRLLHPFMPYITEELWEKLPLKKEMPALIISKWPVTLPALNFPDSFARFTELMEEIRGIRNLRAELGISPSKKLTVSIRLLSKEEHLPSGLAEEEQAYICFLSNVDTLRFVEKKPEKSATAYVDPYKEIYVTIGELINWEEEKKRLEKEIEKVQKDFQHAESKLMNPKFMENADRELVEEAREKQQGALKTLKRLHLLLQELKADTVANGNE